MPILTSHNVGKNHKTFIPYPVNVAYAFQAIFFKVISPSKANLTAKSYNRYRSENTAYEINNPSVIYVFKEIIISLYVSPDKKKKRRT